MTMLKKPFRKKPIQKLSKNIATQTITLIASSFGLVSALAWNEAIKEYVAVFVKPYFQRGSGVVSLFIYAIAITVVTVIVTIQLNKIANKVSEEK